MRAQSPEYRRCNDRLATAAVMMRSRSGPVDHRHRRGRRHFAVGGAGDRKGRRICRGCKRARGVYLAGNPGPARCARYDRRPDPPRSPGEQRVAYLPSPNATAADVEGAAAGVDLGRRRDGGERERRRCPRRDLPPAGDLQLPGRFCFARHGLADDERAAATEHQGRQSWRRADKRNSTLGRGAADDSCRLSTVIRRARHSTTVNPTFSSSSGAAAAN